MIELDPNSPPYAGEQLVADDSYLRRLPVALVTKERMRFDAVVTAADIITEAFGALRQFTAHAAVDLDKFSNGGRAFALSQMLGDGRSAACHSPIAAGWRQEGRSLFASID